MIFVKATISSLVLLLPPLLVQAQAKTDQEVPKAVPIFVQRFYDWYVPRALADSGTPAWRLVLVHRPSALSPHLARALTEDSEAQAKAKGVIVGLDFDPFLAAQDPCDRYEVGTSIRKGVGYWVKVYSVCSGKRTEGPAVVAELVRRNRSWVFVNLHYPGNGGDLLTVLEHLRRGRQ